MTKRRVRPDELELWQRVVRTTEKLAGFDKPAMPSETGDIPADVTMEKFERTEKAVAKFRVGEKARTSTRIALPEPSVTSQPNRSLGMDARTFAKMKRGKMVPEGKIDLHGLTLDQAHSALNRFILSSHNRGLRLVLVITGKGGQDDPYDPVPRSRGVLKRQVPQWLQMPPLSSSILQISEASRRHGGSGACYVYLRRL